MARSSTRPRGTHRPAPGFAGAAVRLRRRVTWGRAVWRRAAARPGVDHLVRAGRRFSDRLGNQFAAAITYFSFLSLVPILMVTFSAAGFVLASRPDLLDGLKTQVTALLGASIGAVVDKAVGQRTTVGVIGLLVAAYSGLSWIGNVRDAVQAQWRPHWVRGSGARQGYWMDRLTDLISLGGLLLAVLVSFSLTAVGTAAQDLVIRLLGLQGAGWLDPVLTIGPFVVAIAADVLIFAWVYTIFPAREYRAPRRTLLAGALAMAVCFEVLKALLTLVVTRLSHSASGVVFGSVIGLLFFFNLVARAFLMVAAWIATGAEAGWEAAGAGGGEAAVGGAGLGDGAAVGGGGRRADGTRVRPATPALVPAISAALALGWLLGRRCRGGRRRRTGRRR